MVRDVRLSIPPSWRHDSGVVADVFLISHAILPGPVLVELYLIMYFNAPFAGERGYACGLYPLNFLIDTNSDTITNFSLLKSGEAGTRV